MNTHASFTLVLVLTLSAGTLQAVDFDHDGDGDVDLADHQAMVDCYGGPADPLSSGCEVFDENGDAHVDLFDFRGFQAAFSDGEAPLITRLQLAGNALGGYPYFEYVRAFNENATVQVAVDPTLHPDIVGRTCDVYVVNAKTGGEWAVDPSLSDVRVDGPQTESFGGTTIQDNTFTVADPFELDADAGAGLGVGYDLVLDCDRDGQLGGGDFIDGLSQEAGLYVVHDTTQPGPLAFTEVTYSGGTWLGQRTYYPTAIASLEQLPLVVISHGNGHNYTWYHHIGRHLASYGYIVMSHENNTGPGVETASGTTLTNTDYIISSQAVIGGGVLNGHIDSSRITWIGHSRGGEGVVRAHTRLRTGEFVPDHYDIDDIILVSSMAPVTHITPAASSTPWDVNYHMFHGAADSDVSGSPSASSSKPLALYERGFGNKQLIYIHGCGHAWLHAGPADPSWADGPDLIGQAAAHTIVKGYLLPLVQLYVDGNIVGKDFFARMYEGFHPIGIPANVIIANEFDDAADSVNFVIDDYESETGASTSSSGGAVTYDVENLSEVLMGDFDESFAWTGGQPSNGMTRYRYSDESPHGVVFDWSTAAERFYELEVVPAARDFTDDAFLSFRACQGTRHPRTDALDSPLSFTASLRDGDGVTSSIDFASFGRITRTYLRTGSGGGAGWANEFSTVRIRLTDFLNNGSGLDLANVVALRFDFGASFGSPQGRIGLDSIKLTHDFPPIFVPLTLSLPGGAPEFFSPTNPTVIDVEIFEGSDTLAPDSAKLFYRYAGGAYQNVLLAQVGSDLWQGTLPPPDCEESPEYYLEAEGVVTGLVRLPSGAPAAPFTAFVGDVVPILDDDFETDQGWTVENIALTDGDWQRGIPVNCGRGDPPEDFDGSGRCYVTDNSAVSCNSDVDGGPTRLISPLLDLSLTGDPILRYARWMACDDAGTSAEDFLEVEISDDDGASWVLVESVPHTQAWVHRQVRINDLGIALTDQFRVRFSVADNPNNSITEAGIDAVKIFDVECE